MANSYTASCPFCQASAIREGDLTAKLEAEQKAHELTTNALRSALEKYATLVQTYDAVEADWTRAEAALAKVFEETRERCAKVCDEIVRDWYNFDDQKKAYAGEYIAKVIRSLESAAPQDKFDAPAKANNALARALDRTAAQDNYPIPDFLRNQKNLATEKAAALQSGTPKTDAEVFDSFDASEELVQEHSDVVVADFARQLERELADSRQLLNAYQRWLKEAEAIADHKRAKAWQEIVHMPAKPSIAIPVLDLDRDKNASLSDAKSLLRDARPAVAYAANNTTSQLWRNELDDLLARIDASVKEGE